MSVSKTQFIKDLKSIIFENDYFIDLYKKGVYTGCIHFSCDKTNGLTKADVMADITVEKIENEYDYDKDDGSTITYLALWIENVAGYTYYEFDSWNIRSL